MSRARAYLAALAALLALLAGLVAPVAAQEADEGDRGFIQRLLEENLSGAGREVRMTGFRGALSSRATIDRLTIADGEGVWITLRGVAMQWNRAALLRGRIDIAELSAEAVEVARAPVAAAADSALPDPAARPFRLPDLPVAVRIGTLRAASVTLGAPLLGEEVALSLEGSGRLEGGEGDARLAVRRIDGTEGALSLDAGFANANSTLRMSLDLTEPRDGIAARLLNLPGRPALRLTVDGEGPLSDFLAEVALASDGETRLTGTVELIAEAPPEAAPGAAPEPAARRFVAEFSGDLAPLFLPEYRDFFGTDVRLAAEGRRAATGAFDLDRLRIRAAALTLDGRLSLAADGLPAAFALTGRIAAPGGGPVRLPVSGEAVEVASADLDLSFDAARGDAWTGRVLVQDFRRGGNRIARLSLEAGGDIARAGGRRLTATFAAAAEGIAPADAGVAAALGPDLRAEATVVWQEGAPVAFRRLTLGTANGRLTTTATLGPLAEGLPLTLRGSADLADLSVLSALAGRPLAGRVVLGLNGIVTLLDGRFDVRLGGAGRNLAAGLELFDRVIAGESRLVLDARRDEQGLTLRRLRIVTAEAEIAGSGQVRRGATALEAAARLTELSRVVPELSGPAAVEARLRETAPGTYDLSAAATGPGGARADFAGTLAETAAGTPRASGRLSAGVADLSAYARLAGQPIRGRADLTFEGSAAPAQDRFDGTLALTGQGLGIGQPTADRLLGGTLRLSAAATRAGEVTTVRRFDLASGEGSVSVTGTLGRVEGRLSGEARLRNVGIFAPDFPGPAAAAGTVSRTAGGRWGVDIRATGPGGTTASVTGSAAPDFSTFDLRARGNAPLGLANEAIAPRAVRGTAAFDLALDGPPRLQSLTGRVTTQGARLVAPVYGVAVDGISGSATLAGGRATVDLSGAVEGGGRVGVTGGVGLAPPFDAGLRIALSGAAFSEPDLFRTTISGEVSLTGPLTAGALLGGVLNLGETEVRIADTGRGAGGELEGLRHVREPPDVRLTRLRAGFVEEAGGAGGGGQARPLRLDLLINAPNRIFIRGRGLDAELGGSLRLAGTTVAVAPQGQFELIRGRLDILGRRLALDTGLARLEGSFDPWVRLVATTEAEDITVRIVVEGLVSEPAIRFESSPELPQDEVLARLFFGRDIAQLSPLQAARLASAIAELTGRGGVGIVGRLRENFGLDDLDVTTDEEGNAAVRAGRYVSENAYTEVTVGSDGKADISINLDLSRSLTVRGSVDSQGETGVGIFFERDY
ncbi:MAG: translocation/assembly module TamB domain-containing protein [Rhodobacteraceae bacterium]|nr:translocation/assembly module TamB domain-containing protein [Paracoccaceae bacterium]